MATRRVALVADGGDLLSGYDAGEHLSGVKPPSFRLSSGRPVSGRPLDRLLYDGLGIGDKVITVRGTFQPAAVAPLEVLPTWERTTRVAGSLDAGTLGRIVHELVRRFRDAEAARLLAFGVKDTPPLVFVSGIYIRTETPAVKPLARRVVKRRNPKTGKLEGKVSTRREYFVDTVTGRRVSRETWNRSRAAIRARTPKGEKAKQGRYVRRVTVT